MGRGRNTLGALGVDPSDRLSDVDGVITQSTTFAAEAAYLGVPTLLVSAAERGFLDRVEAEGGPCFGTVVHARVKHGWTSGPAGPRAWR